MSSNQFPSNLAAPIYQAFLRGFAHGAKIAESEAAEVWLQWTRMETILTRCQIENGGLSKGITEGEFYAEMMQEAEEERYASAIPDDGSAGDP